MSSLSRISSNPNQKVVSNLMLVRLRPTMMLRVRDPTMLSAYRD